MIRRTIEAAVGNPVAMNLAMLIVLGLGIASYTRLPRENFPDFSVDRVGIFMVYEGASPAEIEEGLCLKIEEAIDGIAGIWRIESVAREGVAEIYARVEPGEDPQRIIDEVKQALDRVTTFPEGAEDPEVRDILIRTRVMEVVLHGKASERTLKELSRELRDELLQATGVSQIAVLGTRDYEIAIELEEETLRAYGLTFEDVAGIVSASSLNLPAGSVKSDREQYLVRIFGRRYRGRAFEDIVVRARPDGTALRLGEIATVRDGFEEEPITMQVDGDRAVMLTLYKTKDQNAIRISNAVKSYVAKKSRTLPTGLNLVVWSNETRYIEARLELLTRNGWMGLILVFVSLWLFLDFRLAFWVAWGIPVSFAGALIIFELTGQTFNLISAFGLIMALGIVVDDAIVVGENVYAHRERGLGPLEAAIHGATEVAVPVIASTLTTLAAFLPLFMIKGVMGKFIAVLPLAMVSCLVVSLFEAMGILPVHLRHGVGERATSGLGRLLAGLRGLTDALFVWLQQTLYRPLLGFALDVRAVTISIFTALLLIAAGAYAGGFLATNFFPKEDSESYIARLRLSDGTPVRETQRLLEEIEAHARRLDEDFAAENGGPVVDRIIAVSGQWSGLPPEFGTHFGEVQLELTPAESRKVDSERILARWRERVGKIPEAVSLLYRTRDLRPGGAPIEILLLDDDLAALRAAADDLKSRLERYDGVFDIEDDLRPGKRELRFDLSERGRTTGITLLDLGRQMRGAFFGTEARRIQRGRDEVRVKVRYPLERRRRLEQLSHMRVRGPTGEVPLGEVSNLTIHRGVSKIRRRDRQRVVTVLGDVDEARANASEVLREVVARHLPEICEAHGVGFSLEGQHREAQESIESLGPGFVLALFLIYCILAVLFKSYLQPFIIMVAIPFGLVGVVAGHLAWGLELTMLSLFGAVALAGIVVNDALVLVDFINRARAEGRPLRESVEAAGIGRFRAIVLTSLTTIAGLLPIVTETDRQAKFIIPMAITISAGLLFATFINLILVPALYLALGDFRRFGRWLKTGTGAEPPREPEGPAQVDEAASGSKPAD